MKCKMCGTAFVPGEDKFCEGCGMELPTVAATMSAPAQKSSTVLDTDDVVPASTTGPSNAVGRNSIQSSSNNTANSNNITTTNTTVNNTTTTIEDDTKKSIVCAVSGKRVLYIESVCCRGCEKDVSLEYYNENTRRCENCHKSYLQKYRDEYKQALESGGGIDRQERAELNVLAQQLFLTDDEIASIETELRNLKASEIENEATGFDDLFEMELSIVKQEIFKKNNLSSALIRLGDLFRQVQTNDEISCFYFLIKSIMSPGQYITNYESASYDEFWENYWLFIPYLRKGDHVKVMKSFRDNYAKFSDKKNEIYLAETVYLMMRFQVDQTDMLIENATNKITLIESISGNLLTKLYKSNSQLLDAFDYGLSKFSDLTPPNEPGMKEYHLFFLNHLYKIESEVPSQASKSIPIEEAPIAQSAPSIPSAPQVVSTPPLPSTASIPSAPPTLKVPGAPPVPKAPVASPQPAAAKPMVPGMPPAPTAPPAVKLPGAPPSPSTPPAVKVPGMPPTPTAPPAPKAPEPKLSVPPMPKVQAAPSQGPKLPGGPNVPMPGKR